MEQLFFFTDLQSIDLEELEGKIDPLLDQAFLAEMGHAFATLPENPERARDVDAA
jgi:hypothetical protein